MGEINRWKAAAIVLALIVIGLVIAIVEFFWGLTKALNH